jgi:WD40 repeat protein
LTIELWDLTTRKGLCVLPVARQVRSLAFSPDGKVLAVGDGDGNLLLYQVATPGSPPKACKAHEFPLLSLTFSTDGQTLATGSSDMRSIRLWNVADGTPRPETFAGQVGDVWSLAFSPDGTRLASGTRDGPIRIWNLANRGAPELVEEQVDSHEYGNFIFSPDSKWMAAGCTGNLVKVWEVATSRLETILTNATYVVAFSNDSKSLLVSTGPSMPHWESLESPSARPIPPYRGQVNTLCAVDLTADRRVAALGLQSGEIQVLEIESGRPTGTALHPHRGAVRSLALSPSGSILASGGDDKELVVTDLRTGSVLGRSFEHKGSVCAVAISPDGTLLASGCSAETLKFWQLSNISTGSTASISYHKSVIRTLAFSPDGATLASGSEDKTVRLWSVRLHREVASFKLYDHVRLVVFSPDGNTLAAVTDGGTLRVFRAPSLREADEFPRQ